MQSPTLDEFLKLADQGNLIPVTARILADIETPLSAYRKIRGQGESFLFESVEGGEHLGRYSFVGCNPARDHQTDGQQDRSHSGRQSSGEVRHSRARQRAVRELREGRPRSRRARDEEIPPGHAAGAAAFHRRRRRLHRLRVHPRRRTRRPATHRDELGTPTMYFIVADQLLVFDRVAQTITVLVNAAIDEAASPTEAYESAVEEIERLLSLLEQPSEHNPVSIPAEVPPLPFASNQTQG
jgi:anthranilate synthase component 1